MAKTKEGKHLTEEHRMDQIRLAERLSRLVRGMFRRHVNYEDIDASTLDFVKHTAGLVLQFREASRMLSVDYLTAFQAVEAPDLPPVREEPDDYDFAVAAQELSSTVRGVLKTLSHRGYSAEDAMDRAETAVAAKAIKLAGDGGRNVIETEVRRGNGPVGYARVVDKDPCAFCSMLASRGVYYVGKEAPGALLYRSDSFADSNARFKGDGRFKVHDGCCCTLEPVYMRDGRLDLPGVGNELAREWAEIAAGRSDAWLVWQRWRQSGTLPEDYEGDLSLETRRTGGKKRRSSPRVKKEVVAKSSEMVKQKVRGKGHHGVDRDAVEVDLVLTMQRVSRIDQEIGELKARGQSDQDISVKALLAEKQRQVSIIDRQEKHLERMGV